MVPPCYRCPPAAPERRVIGPLPESWLTTSSRPKQVSQLWWRGARRRALARAPSATLSHPLGTVADVARPRTFEEPRVPTAVRLPESLHDRLHREASARDVSANLLVTRALEAYLEKLPPVEEVAP